MIDAFQQLNAVERSVGTRVLAAGEARVVTLSQVYDTTVQDLWDACTNPARIPRWFLPISGELHVGGRYQLEGQAGGVIERCDPPHSFAATWEFGSEVSWIEVSLSAEADGRTRLQLDHIAPLNAERWAEFGPGAVGVGWEGALLGLASYLSTGAAMDPQESAAWMASDEARRFYTLSSERWGEASIAAGTDAAAARAAAARTTAFYTGSEPQPSPAGG
jgi:uncharacterized protein YndB with AHSA1/START domain